MAPHTSPCPVETTLNAISNRWVALILRDLLLSTKRFGELKKSLPGISQKVLTANLRTLESEGLVVRTAYLEIPPRVEYSLTALGESLRPVLMAMYNWGVKYKVSQGEDIGEDIVAMGEELRKRRRVKDPAAKKAKGGQQSAKKKAPAAKPAAKGKPTGEKQAAPLKK